MGRKVRNIPCSLCDKLFVRDGDLKQHISDKHPNYNKVPTTPQPQADMVPRINFVRGSAEVYLPSSQSVNETGAQQPYPSSSTTVHSSLVQTSNAGPQPGLWNYEPTHDWETYALTTLAQPFWDASGPARAQTMYGTPSNRTYPPQIPPDPFVYDHGRVMGTQDPPFNNDPPTNREAVFQGGMASTTGKQSGVLPKPKKQKLCTRCPELPGFVDKAALIKHKEEQHSVPCPVCSAPIISSKKLKKHLKKVHGIVNNIVQPANQTVPEPTDYNLPAEPPHTNSLPLTFGDLGEPSRPTSVSYWDGRGLVVPGIHGIPPGRLYCEEYGCGGVFLFKAHLESHMRYGHPKQPSQGPGGEKAATTSSNDVPEAAKKCAEQSLAHFSPTIGSGSGKRATPDGPDSPSPAETHAPVLVPFLWEYPNLNGGKDLQQTFEDPPKSPVAAQSDINVPPAVTTSTSLSLQCRICEAPPTTGTRPTITVCGHLFCYECIAQCVASTSKCPVCDTAVLLYYLFKLDLPVSP